MTFKNTLSKSLVITIAAILAFQNLAMASNKCENVVRVSQGLTDDSIESKLAEILELNDSSRSLLRQPEVLMYIYLRFFEEGIKDIELEDTLAKIAIIDNQTDIFNFFTKEIGKKLESSEKRQAVKEAFAKQSFDQESKGYLEARKSKTEKVIAQLKAIPTTISNMRKIVKTDLAITKMDERFFDMYGGLKLGLKDSLLRPWKRVEGSFGAIHPSQIENIDPVTWAHIAIFGSEIEAGIEGYSQQSGEMFRGFLKNLSLFSGKTVEQAQLGVKDRGFCSNVWCSEENRHTGMLRSVYRQITGMTPPAENPSEAYHNLSPFNVDDVLFHLVSRNATEWNAISGYTMMGSHAKGAAYDWIQNIREDEIKHMAIFSAGFKLVFGDQPNLRLKMMLKKIKTELAYESGKSEYGASSKENPAILSEIAMAHLIVESQVRKYIASLPLKTLQKIFYMDATLPEPKSAPVAPEKQAQIDRMLTEQTSLISNLSRWKKSDREEALKLKEFESKSDKAQLVKNVIETVFKNFKGLESYDSEASQKAFAKMKSLKKEDLSVARFASKLRVSERASDMKAIRELEYRELMLLRKSLEQTLRDYQIMNNQAVRKAGARVELRDLTLGYEVILP